MIGYRNITIIKTYNSGREIYVPKFVWKHTGVIMGKDEYDRTLVAQNHPSKPKLVTIEEFCEGEAWVFTGRQNLNFEELIQRFKENEFKDYSVLFENCQHFSSQLISGKSSSDAVWGTLAILGLMYLLTSSDKSKKRL